MRKRTRDAVTGDTGTMQPPQAEWSDGGTRSLEDARAVAGCGCRANGSGKGATGSGGADDSGGGIGSRGGNGGRPPRRNGGRRPPGAIVAGGAGFLGSHLCARLLDDGYRVYCVDSFETGLERNIAALEQDPRFVLIEHDVRDGFPAIAGVEEVYNLACPASPPHYQRDPVHTMTTNVMGTLNLIEMAAQRGARFLLASTSEVYGEPEVHPQPESYRGNVSTTGPRACYDEGKRAAEALAYDFLRMRKVDVRTTRIFNTYGPHMRADDGRIISNFVTQALRGEPMTVYGSGQQTRSFCFVSDLIEGIVRLMRVETPPPGPVNLGNPTETSILAVAELITQLTGSNVPIEHRPLPVDDPTRRRPNIDLAASLLHWAPQVALRDGLARTIAWFAGAAEETPAADAMERLAPDGGGRRQAAAAQQRGATSLARSRTAALGAGADTE